MSVSAARSLRAALCAFYVVVSPLAVQAGEARKGPAPFDGLTFRSIGPSVGGRVSRAVGVPGDPRVYYAATASGGVWKSSDAGIHWTPIFDDQPSASIGSIAVAPSDPNVVYVGSGEANIRGNVAAGNGIYRSLDAGKTWTHVWKQEGQIGTLVVDPRDAQVAFAAVLGHAFGPNPERGVYRTRDSGRTWQQVLKKDADTGASDVALDPSNPNVVFAGLWQARRRPWEMTSGGPGSGLYVSRDGGDSWTQLKAGTRGLPAGLWGKVGVAVAPSDGRRVYALIEAQAGGLFRSDDGGETWQHVNGHNALSQRAWYYSTLTVDPQNPDVVWFPQVPLLRTLDGGRSIQRVLGAHHGDHHDVWIDARDPRRMIVANDGGVDISLNRGETWYAPPLPIAQFYHVSADESVPYNVMGAMQDLGTARGPSNSLGEKGISRGHWRAVGGGEAGHAVADPADPYFIYAGEYGGYVSLYDDRTRQARHVGVYPEDPSGHGAEDLKHRFQWTAPIAISRHDPKTVYHGANVLFRTRDGGQSWTAVSPDLTRNDKSKQKWSGGPITGDNTGVEIYGTIFALALSPRAEGVIWAGSDDGLVHVTRDSGTTWKKVTPPGLPEWATVSLIEASPFDAATAYVVVDAHRLDDMRPYLWKTSDYGVTWTSLTAGLSRDVYLHAVREDPQKRGQLYLGTERGVTYSPDDGATWQVLALGLPTVAVHDLVVKGDDLVLGTSGRSLWIFDDLTPLRETNARVRAADVHLFSIRPAKRWRYHPQLEELGQHDNPPEGAVFHYFLADKPKGELQLQILDAQGAVVRTLGSTAEVLDLPPDDPDADKDELPKPALPSAPGVQRATWDLRYEGGRKIKGAKIDLGDPTQGPLAPPGTYTARLIVDGRTLSAAFTVEPDPRVRLEAAVYRTQLEFLLQVRDSFSRVTETVERLRRLRGQLVTRADLGADSAEWIQAARARAARLDALEAELHNPQAQVTYDILAQKGGAKLYSRLSALLSFGNEGDGLPTQGLRELFAEQQQELQGLGARFDAILADVEALNEQAAGAKLIAR